MQRQSGNFLLQSLLALTLIFAFVPFITRRMVSRDMGAQMHVSASQVDVAQTAARIYVRENANSFPYEVTVISGDAFVDTLEPYGLPLGFVARTALGQDISLVITKDLETVSAYLELTGGNLTGVARAELARRIGFYAEPTDDGVRVGIALDDQYSDVVRRNETNLDNGAFLTNLDMGKFNINNTGDVLARNGTFDTARINTLSITGSENGRKERNNINEIRTAKTVFQSKTGESALTLTRGTLNAESVTGRTIARFGDAGNLTTESAAVYDFSMTAGRTSFTGPEKWNVRGNVVTDKISFSVERLEVNSFINASRGQDVFVDEETLEYNPKSGIEAKYLYTSNITLRDQTSSSLANGGTGRVILDVRPGETSLLPDVLVDGINNDKLNIIKNPAEISKNTETCKSVIEGFGGRYNSKSLSQNIICQYVFWLRLEQRIDIKQCMLEGRSDCR